MVNFFKIVISTKYDVKKRYNQRKRRSESAVIFLPFAHTFRVVRYEKIYVAMYLYICDEGYMKPVAVEWADGTRYEIDKIIDERNAPPEHTGGVLTRKYRVLIRGKEKIIYLDKQTNRWFVEKPLCG